MNLVLTRILLAVLTAVLSTPIYAACPLLANQKSTPDCCHKTEGCPKPVKVQNCLNCVADVRLTATAPEQVHHATVAAAPAILAYLVPSAQLTVLFHPRLPDRSGTYLRIGVLRI
jgi:hypothetical protein